MMARFKAQYDSLGLRFTDEKNRQAEVLRKRAELRKRNAERTRRIKITVGSEQERQAEVGRAVGLHAAFQRVNEAAAAGLGDESDELLRLLREWAAERERHHREHEAKKLAATSVDLESDLVSEQFRTLIRRLM